MIDIFRAPEQRNTLGNPAGDRGFQTLQTSIKWSYKKLEPFRRTSKDLISMYCGGSYGDNHACGSILVNLLEMAISIYQRQLASHTPQAMVDAAVHAYRPVAYELSLAINHVIDKQLDLGTTLNKWVINAMFGLGIIKVGEMSPSNPRPMGFRSNGLHLFAKTIGIEDWFHDVLAKAWEDVEYAGHSYDMAIDEILDNQNFDDEARDAVWASVKHGDFDREYADPHSERPESIGHGESLPPDEYVPKATVCEVWTTRDDLIITYLQGGAERPLETKEREGPAMGPYHLLGFSPVPGNVMPLAPAQLWQDILDLHNRLAVKIADQADRQRTVMAGHQRAAGAMNNITQTADGETVLTDCDPNLIKEFRFGGVDPSLMTTWLNLKDSFSYIAGNLDTLGGLGPSSQTIGQDKMIKEQASERLADYQERVVKATTRVITDIGWYLWHNDEADIPLTKKITSRISRDFRWNRFSRAGDFYDYVFSVTPYSLKPRTPNERLQVLNMIVNQTIMPALELLASQGISFDIFKYLEHVARLSSTAEVEDLVRNAEGRMLNQREPYDQMHKAPVSQRTYTRQNIPGNATPEGRSANALEQFQKMAQQQQSMQPNGQGTMPRPGRPAGGGAF